MFCPTYLVNIILAAVSGLQVQQDSEPLLFSKQKEAVFLVGFNGETQIRSFVTKQIADPAGLIGLLRSEEVRKDVELVDSQKTSIKQALKKADSCRVELKRALLKRDGDEQAQRLFSDTVEEIEELFDSELLIHQQERLRQVERRHRMRSDGFLNFLFFDNELSNDGMMLSGEEKKQLRVESQKLRNEISRKSREMLNSKIEKLLDILDEEQVRKMENRIETFRQSYAIDVFGAHLALAEEPIPKLDDLISSFVQPMVLHAGSDGMLTPFRPGDLKITGSLDKFFGLQEILSELTGEQSVNILELTPGQIQELQVAQEELSSAYAKIDMMLFETEHPFLDFENAKDMQNLVTNTIRSRLNDTLSQDQLARLGSMLEMAVILKNGLISELMHGPIELTVDQKRKLGRLSKEIYEELKAETRAIENDAVSRLLNKLQSGNRRIARKALGGDIKHGGTSIALLMRGLSNEKNQ